MFGYEGRQFYLIKSRSSDMYNVNLITYKFNKFIIIIHYYCNNSNNVF